MSPIRLNFNYVFNYLFKLHFTTPSVTLFVINAILSPTKATTV